MNKIEEMAKIYQLETALRVSDQFEITQSDLNKEVKQAYTQGWKDCLKHSEEVNELVKALEELEEVTIWKNGELIRWPAKEALSKFREKVGE
jgi:hypothetical protein